MAGIVTQPAPTETRHRPSLQILKAGVLAGLLATLFSALTIELLAVFAPMGPDTYPGAWNIVKATLILCAITVISCGFFGFFAGVVGGTVLYFRKNRIRSVRRLLLESAVAGLALGCIFPVFDAAVNSESLESFRRWLNPLELRWCAPAGLISALLCALAFRKRFVQ